MAGGRRDEYLGKDLSISWPRKMYTTRQNRRDGKLQKICLDRTAGSRGGLYLKDWGWVLPLCTVNQQGGKRRYDGRYWGFDSGFDPSGVSHILGKGKG